MILVTGGTGAIGSELLRLLSQAGIPARVLSRSPNKTQNLPGITWVVGDLARPETLATAFEDAKSLFLLTHYYEDMVELQHNAIVAARTAGVEHVVKVSAFAATDHSKAPIGQWHYQIEKELEDSRMAWTMLQPHHFMTNLVAQAEYVIKEGTIYSPSGDGKIPYVDPRDVAAVAFVTLTQPGHFGKTYVVTGSEAISYREASEIIGATIGKKLRFVDETPEQARARRIREGVPPAVIESVLAIGAYQRAGGKTVTITNTVAELTGRPPRTVAEFVQENASVFRG
ncbi:SDR family oxidoreductase [Bradyrhizobium cytisi]|nr:SDR family oxidoreductase [Bradyrhizobium cytisi]